LCIKSVFYWHQIEQVEVVDAPNSREHTLSGADSRVHPLRHFIARDRPLSCVLVFEVRPALVACDNVAKMGSLHSLPRAKKLTTFYDPHLP
jgi:hypothetical protein